MVNFCRVFEGTIKKILFGEWEIRRCGARPVGHLTVFFAGTAGHLTKDFQKNQMPGGLPGGDDRSWN